MSPGGGGAVSTAGALFAGGIFGLFAGAGADAGADAFRVETIVRHATRRTQMSSLYNRKVIYLGLDKVCRTACSKNCAPRIELALPGGGLARHYPVRMPNPTMAPLTGALDLR